jgi:hypothetical protein
MLVVNGGSSMADRSRKGQVTCPQCGNAAPPQPPPHERPERCNRETLCDECKEILGKLLERVDPKIQGRFWKHFTNKQNAREAYQNLWLGVVRKRGYSQIAPDNEKWIDELVKEVEARLNDVTTRELVQDIVAKLMEMKLQRFATYTLMDEGTKQGLQDQREVPLHQPLVNAEATDDEPIQLPDTIKVWPDNGLTLHECLVLELTIGWKCVKKWTYKLIGKELNLSPDRIKQIRGEGLKKLGRLLPEREAEDGYE